ncbi:unnamed protein product [Ixodes persulcatus]
MRAKDRLHKAFLKSRDLVKLAEFKLLRNHLNADLRRAKRNYYNQLFDSECMKHPDLLWERLNALLGKNTNNNRIKKLVIDGMEKCGSALSDAFNRYFVNVGSSTYCSDAAQNIPRVCDTIFFILPMNMKFFRR